MTTTETFHIPIPVHVDETMMKEHFLTDVSINSVLFSYHDEKLHVLLLRLTTSDHFMLPGGFIKKEEDVDEAAIRNLEEMTGLDQIYLQQFYVAGNAGRTCDPNALDAFKKFGLQKIEQWLTDRKVSVCYYALVNSPELQLKVNEAIICEIKWTPVEELPPLLFDHQMVIDKAIRRLQLDMDRKVISTYLLNETFTMPELQKLYEAVYQEKLTRSNFQRRMLNLDILERLGKRHDGGSHRAPYLYRFNPSKIEMVLN
tara:strand:+ start:41284 stop:42054 length:771 start_codon:yes stop_codon:yes gene_type:complete